MPRSFLLTNQRYPNTVYSNNTDVNANPAEDYPTTADPQSVHALYTMEAYRAFLAAALCSLSQQPVEPLNLSRTSAADPSAAELNSDGEKRESDTDQQLSPSTSGDSLYELCRYECLDCGKVYSTSSNLARHRQVHRSSNDQKARSCPHCGKVYVSMPAFSMHLRTHNQGCSCNVCGKSFSRPWLLQGHLRTHTGEKPFKCNLCPKSFADKSNLRAHVQTHSGKKPYQCKSCGKSFALKSYLYKHEEASCLKGKRKSKN